MALLTVRLATAAGFTVIVAVAEPEQVALLVAVTEYVPATVPIATLGAPGTGVNPAEKT